MSLSGVFKTVHAFARPIISLSGVFKTVRASVRRMVYIYIYGVLKMRVCHIVCLSGVPEMHQSVT